MSTFNGFADLDDLDDAPVAPEAPRKPSAEEQERVSMFGARGSESAHGAVYSEPCKDCRGTGRFHSFTGRYIGPCFKCEGKGVRHFKTSPESRARARNSAVERKAREEAAKRNAALQNLADYPDQDLARALLKRAEELGAFGQEFAASLVESIKRFGKLTERQEEAARKMFAPRPLPTATAQVDFRAVEEKFATAQRAGLKRPKLHLLGFTLSPAPATGRNAGAIYVVDDADTYLGKVQDGAFYKSRECTAEQVAALEALSGDVLASAVAYGKQTGCCSCCNRLLENEESVRLGIGPICRAKWGL